MRQLTKVGESVEVISPDGRVRWHRGRRSWSGVDPDIRGYSTLRFPGRCRRKGPLGHLHAHAGLGLWIVKRNIEAWRYGSGRNRDEGGFEVVVCLRKRFESREITRRELKSLPRVILLQTHYGDANASHCSKTQNEFAALFAAGVLLSACGTTTSDRAVSGGLLGAGTGAIIVPYRLGRTCSDWRLGGAAIGALQVRAISLASRYGPFGGYITHYAAGPQRTRTLASRATRHTGITTCHRA